MERFTMNKLFPEKPPLKKTRAKPRTQSESGKKRKAKIPAAVQEAIWIKRMGRVFEGKCLTTWCPNIINVFDFHAGHDIPESKGGTIDPENLYPICARCNLSMGDRYTFKEWCAMSHTPQVPIVPVSDPPPKKRKWWQCK
jgi:hypothetical protein